METRSFLKWGVLAGATLVAAGAILLMRVQILRSALDDDVIETRPMGAKMLDPESFEFFRRIPWMRVSRVRVFGPAFPKVNSGEVSGVITDQGTVKTIVAGFMMLPRARKEPDPPETRTSGFEFEWKEPDGRVVRRTFTFNVESEYLERRPLYILLNRLSKRHGFGFDRTWTVPIKGQAQRGSLDPRQLGRRHLYGNTVLP